MLVYFDFFSDGSNLDGQIQFTGPCARLKGNEFLTRLKEFQDANHLQGNIYESRNTHIRHISTISDDSIVSFSGTDSKSIKQSIIAENKKYFPDSKINVKVFNQKDKASVVVSDGPIPADIKSDFTSKTFKIDGEEAVIDENLCDLIKILNKKGYVTKFCCSGHRTVPDGIIEIMDGKGYNQKQFQHLYPGLEHGQKTITLYSLRPLISMGYISFEKNEKTISLFERLEKDCPACKNGKDTFGTDLFNMVMLPCVKNKSWYSDEPLFYTEYPDDFHNKKRLIIRWAQSSDSKVLKNIKEELLKYL